MAPDGVWSAASGQVGLHDRHRKPASIHTCFPHPIRRYAAPSPLRGEEGTRRPALRRRLLGLLPDAQSPSIRSLRPTTAIGSRWRSPGAPALRRLRQRAGAPNHLFQGRFGSAAMDEDHLMAAAGAVPLNPAPARLVERARGWPHSSVKRASRPPATTGSSRRPRSSTGRRSSPISSMRTPTVPLSPRSAATS